MSDGERERVREISAAAFGQRYRLEMMLAIGESPDGLVCLTDLARDLDVSISNLQNPLKSLLATHLLTPLPRGDARRRFYLRAPSAAWTWALELSRHSVYSPGDSERTE